MDKYIQNSSKKTDTFWIAGLVNPEYVVFFEKSKFRSCLRNTLSFRSHYKNITKEFRKKKINVIEIEHFNCDESQYQCYEDDKKILYDGLKYPSFGVLYVLFDTYNFENQKIVNYYTVDRYSFQMKAYVHDFLIFLSQSFGAKQIQWSYSIDKTSQESANVSVSTTHQGVTAETGTGGENTTEKKSSTDLVLSYDNNGSEIFFETTNNELPWCIKIQKIISDSNVPYDVVKYWRNDRLIEKFLENNKFFRYKFYIENELLVDFVRKRQNGMNEVHHEMVFYDKHRSMFNYYNDIGMKYFTSMGISYSSEQSTSQQSTTFYHVEFYPTNELENITLRRCIVEEKAIGLMKRENEHTINKIREMQYKWEESHPDSQEYKYQYYNRMYTVKATEEKKRGIVDKWDLSSSPGKLFKSSRPKFKLESLCCNRNTTADVYDPMVVEKEFPRKEEDQKKEDKNEKYEETLHKQVIEITENDIKLIRKDDDVYTNIIVILQRYKRYFAMLDDEFAEYKRRQQDIINRSNSQMLTIDLEAIKKEHDTLMTKKKYEFIRKLVSSFYNLLKYSKDEGLDEQQLLRRMRFRMETYYRTVPDKFWMVIVDHILNSVDMENTMVKYLYSVRHLLRKVDVPEDKEKEHIQKKAENELKKKKTISKEQLENLNSQDNKNKKYTKQKPIVTNMIDVYLHIKLVEKSYIYASLSEDERNRVNTEILQPISEYPAYKAIEEDKKDKKNSLKYKDVCKIRLVNKDGGNNYAACDGIYIRDTKSIINGANPYVNKERERFIGRSGKGWVLTGMQWFDAIKEESKDKHHPFGGFHGSEGEEEFIAISKWKEYDVIICNDDNHDNDIYFEDDISEEEEEEKEKEKEEKKDEDEDEDEENEGMILEVTDEQED